MTRKSDRLGLEQVYYWFRYNGIKKIVSMNSIDQLELEQRRQNENRHYIIDNK